MNWTPNVWNKVYRFPRGVGEGWAGRRDGMFAKKFRADPDPKDGFHPGNCHNLRERRALEFLKPMLDPDKFGAMSGVRPVNWRLIIHKIV